ncbi:MAG: ACP S-malonyltransferase [Gammaproteobacteria bacterium]|nr:ACP S-malonyltransferase [Gammaproteobacteria bacterium]
MSTRNIAYLFPGQGAQYPGLGADLHAHSKVARDAYAEAADALGYDIGKLCFDAADAEKIHLTRHTQPALLTHSIACLRAWAAEVGDGGFGDGDFGDRGHGDGDGDDGDGGDGDGDGGDGDGDRGRDSTATVVMAAGHSLGEYCALVSAGALDFAQALRLVKRRGELMGEYGRGEMEALMLDFAAAADLAGRHHCGVAARNLPEQTVLGGAAHDLDALLRDMAARHPRKRSARLKTEGAFHTYHMLDAALHFRETLAEAEFKPLRFGVLSNFTGDLHDADDADALKSRLFLQLFNPVLWYDNLTKAVAAADMLFEFGGGLGKGDGPDAKRPALESMVKKTRAGVDSPPDYLAVNNVRTLMEAARAFAA